MIRLTFLMLAILSISTYCLAESEEDIKRYELFRQAEIKKAEKNIPKIVEQYATSLGCEFAMNPQNVVKFSFDKEKAYIALFSFDLGCSGGSSMSRPVFVVLKHGANNNLYIDPKYSSPHQTSQNFPSTIKSVFIKEGKLWYSALDFDFSKDGLCCPSVPVNGELVYENGNWNGLPEKN